MSEVAPLEYHTLLQDLRLLRKARKLLNVLTEMDLSNLSVINPEDKIQYTHRHKSLKKKHFSPPIDYVAIDMKLDLERAISEKDISELRPLYYRLSRLINF